MTLTKKLIVVLPAYNEGKVIAKVISQIKKEGYKNIIVVDDCSIDNTSLEAARAGAHVLRHIINRGAGAATKTGIDYALTLDADIIVTLDSDGQHDPADIKKVIQPILDNKADVVIGSRLIDPKGMPKIRQIANFFGNLSTYFVFGVKTTDSQSGFKAFSKKAASKIDIKSDRYEFCSEIFHEIKRKKLHFSEVGIKVIYTEYSLSKGQSFVNGIKTLIKMIIRKIIN